MWFMAKGHKERGGGWGGAFANAPHLCLYKIVRATPFWKRDTIFVHVQKGGGGELRTSVCTCTNVVSLSESGVTLSKWSLCTTKNNLHILQHITCTGWRRPIGSPKLQIIFHKRATKYRSLLRKMTYKIKGFYDSSPPCIKSHCKSRVTL